MDLPTCPACGQSVLDDDAQDCPFCGSPMKGGTGKAAPRTPPKAAVKPPVAKPGAKAAESGASLPAVNKPAAKASKADKPSGDDDDPFGSDESTATAVAVSPKKSPGKTHEVKCPMCETSGFVSPKAAGQPVRCCNPECLVPVFNAPKIEKPEAPPPPPPPKRSSVPMYIGVTVVTLIVCAGVVWYLVNSDDALQTQPEVRYVPPPSAPGGNKPDEPKKIDDTDAVALAPAAEEAVANQLKQQIRQLLERIKEDARQAPQTRKAACRQLAALAYAEAGTEAEVKEQLLQLRNVAPGQTQNEILPLVALAWTKLKAGDKAGFKKDVDTALSYADKIPKFGRDSVQSTIALAVALAADGQIEPAIELLDKHTTDDAIDENLAAALFIVQERGSFDLTAPLPGRSLNAWEFPMRVATTVIVVVHGHPDEARNFAAKLPEPARTECLMAWAVAWAGPAAGADAVPRVSTVVDAAKGLSPAGNARVLAALADARFGRGDEKSAADLVGKAVAALGQIAPLPPVKLEGYRPILEYKPPPAMESKQAALAAGQIAEVQAGLKQPDEAWKSVLRAFDYLRGIAPSPGLISARVAENENKRQTVQARLKKDFDITDVQAANRKFTDFRDYCKELKQLSDTRFDLETRILIQIVERGILDPVWELVQSRSNDTDLNIQEPFLTETWLPMLLGARYDAAANEEKRDEVLNAVETPVEAFGIALQRLIDADDVAGSAELIHAQRAPVAAGEIALQLACRLVTDGKIVPALKLVAGLKDELLRADGLRLIAGLAASRQQAAALEKAAAGLPKLSPPEWAALKTGLVEGLVRILPPPAPPAPPAAPAADKDKKKK